jgi:tetratricopeptide (TPR) repeat protein
MSSQFPIAMAAAPDGRPHGAQIQPGTIPPLADCFNTRLETGSGPVDALEPGRLLVLAAPPPPRRPLHDWPGGTGKTQLAIYLAHTWWRSQQIDMVVWASATSRASVLASYVQAFAGYAGTVPAGDAESVAARFLAWLADTDQRWLVVLDDVADPAELAGLWPKGPAGRVLVTTARESLAVGTANPLVFPVGVFSTHEALTYLMERLSADPDQRAGAVDLLHDLGREPLALVQASATIANSGLTCRDYRDMFIRRRQQIADVLQAEPAPKAVTWALSVDRAELLVPGGVAQPCLVLAGLLGCQGIPGVVFSAPAAAEFIAAVAGLSAPDPRHAHTALAGLERTGLLAIDPADGARSVWVHPVVRAAVRSAVSSSLREQAARAAAGALLQVWPEDDEGQPTLAAALRSCVTSLEEAAAGALWAGGAHRVLVRAGESLDGAQLTALAVSHWRAFTAASERALGPGHPDTLRAADRLAGSAVAAGLSNDAVAIYQRTLDARAAMLGPDHPSTIQARADLGSALLAAGRPQDASTVLEGVLAACERGHGADILDGLLIQDNLAAAYLAAGHAPDAMRLAGRTLAERERRQGPDHPQTLLTRASLARACLAAGRRKDAIAHCRRAYEGYERVFGPDHPDTIGALGTLASAYHSARRLKDALPLFERVLAERERVQGPDHPDTLGARGNLASAYHSAGRMVRALELYERSRADCQRVLGRGHPDTIAARANLAHAYYATGRMTEAIKLLQQTLADCERMLAPGDPLTVAVRESLAAVSDA